MSADQETVYKWLKALGTLTASATSAEVADNKLHAYAPLLADEFGQECFCRASLAFVARGSTYFPTFAEVCALLAKWWHSQRPYSGLAIEGPADPWNAEVRAQKEEAKRDWSNPLAIRASVKALEDSPMRIALGRVLAGAVKMHAPHLIGLVPVEFRQPTGDDESKVVPFLGPGVSYPEAAG
jgi:hypothetical protein